VIRVLKVWGIALTLWVSSGSVLAQDQPPTTKSDQADKERELAERLLREATGEREDLMATIVRLMDESTRKLQLQFDPGDETQVVQTKIVDQLDKAIEAAAAQRRPQRQSSPPPRGDKRRLARGQQQQQQSQPEPAAGTGDPLDAPDKGSVQDGLGRGPQGELRETRRAWGHLPMREREELIQGSDEAFLEEYRAWIERYYKALQEAD
jgi:hypothetical protein